MSGGLGVRAYLVYDGQCQRCGNLADVVAKHSKGGVATLPLQGPEATALLTKLMPDGYRRDFYLIEGTSVKKGYAAIPAIFSKLTFIGGVRLVTRYLYHSLLDVRRVSAAGCCPGRERFGFPPAENAGYTRRQALKLVAGAPLFAALGQVVLPFKGLIAPDDIAAEEIRHLKGTERGRAIERVLGSEGYSALRRIMEERGFRQEISDLTAVEAKIPRRLNAPATEIAVVTVPFVGASVASKAFLYSVSNGQVERVGAAIADQSGDVSQIIWVAGQIQERRLQRGGEAQVRPVDFGPRPLNGGQVRPLSHGNPAEDCRGGLIDCTIACAICCAVTFWCCWCFAACAAGYRWCCNSCRCC